MASLYDRRVPLVAVVVIGDWTPAIDNRYIGVGEKIVERLSEGARVVSHFLPEGKALHDFRWFEGGQEQISFCPQEGFMIGDRHAEPDHMPAAFAEIVGRSDARFPGVWNINEGPVFVWAEELTGIKLTPELRGDLSFLGGLAYMITRFVLAKTRSRRLINEYEAA
ncbi:DUF6461 domain-containing protein [Acrocarpospora phusangensis]|uniref:DUF6461 domain-containing protein n=1 Tax=Acrocarpospora phusangensis TaxID=1070424 RepID=UPI0023B2F4D8|nr:DUF6461 domain-containing protein [Acrocarpospora phusangensis]